MHLAICTSLLAKYYKYNLWGIRYTACSLNKPEIYFIGVTVQNNALDKSKIFEIHCVSVDLQILCEREGLGYKRSYFEDTDISPTQRWSKRTWIFYWRYIGAHEFIPSYLMGTIKKRAAGCFERIVDCVQT